MSSRHLARVLVTPLLAAAVLLVGVALLAGLVTILAGSPGWLSQSFNDWALWGLARYHESEGALVLVPAALLLVIGPLVLWRRPVLSQRVVGGAAWVLLFVVVLYLVQARLLWAISRTPWAAGVLLGAALLVWALLSWAYLVPLHALYARVVRFWFRGDSRGETYFALVAPLYCSGKDPMAGRRDRTLVVTRAPLRARFLGTVLQSALFLRGTRIFAWIPGLRSARRPDVPPVRQDPILAGELDALRSESRRRHEVALYGEQALPPIDPAMQEEAVRALDRMVALTDALAECHTLSRASKAELLEGANLLAEASGRILQPTLRAEGDSRVRWWTDESADDWKERTLRLLGTEVRCLEAAYHVKPAPDGFRPVSDLVELFVRQDLSNEEVARFCLAQLAQDAISDRMYDGFEEGQIDTTWANLDRVISGCRSPEWWELRGRYFDASLMPGVDRLDSVIREIQRTFRDLRGDIDTPWGREEHRVLGHAFLLQREFLTELQKDEAEGRAIDAFTVSEHCSLRALHEVIESPVHRAAAQLAAQAARAPAPVQRRKPYAFAELHGSPERFLTPSRSPNWFTRLTLQVAWAPVLFLAVLFTVLASEGGIAEIPDFRLGGEALTASIHSISPGREAEPSIWVATAGEGVHVKAGGVNHYWQRIDARNSGLLSNDVLRVDVGPGLVAYLCASRDRRGVCVSALPAHEPGSRPGLGMKEWRTLIGFSSFPGVDDRIVSAVAQTDDPRVVLFGTRQLDGRPGIGIGRYSAAERRWLDDVAIDEAGGFLPSGHGSVHDLATIRQGDEWVAWAGTDNGLSGGPILGRRVQPGSWRIVPGAELLSPHVRQVRLRRGEDDVVVGYRTAGFGLGAWSPADGSRVIVGESRVPGLAEKTLHTAARAAGSARIWVADRVEGDAGIRLSVYREDSHEWRTQAPADVTGAESFFDLVADRGALDQALVGRRDGLQIVADRQGETLESRVATLEGADVLAAATAEGDRGACFFVRRRADGASSVIHLDRSALGPDGATGAPPWRTVIGSSRVPGLELDRITAAEPYGTDLLLGTRDLGIVRLDPVSREVRPFDVAPADATHTLDLCAVPHGGGDPRLYQVTADHRVRLFGAGEEGGWRTLLGDTEGRADPRRLRDLAADEGRIVLGTGDAISIYDMGLHAWREAPPVEGLQDLAFADAALWAYANQGSPTLSALDEGAPEWTSQFKDVRAWDSTSDSLLVVDGKNRVQLRQGGETRTLVAPVPLEPGTDLPRVAAVDGAVLYLAPVSGGVGRYDLATHHWTQLGVPIGAAQPSRLLCANRAGLWLVDDAGRLFLNPRAAEGETFEGWPEKPLIEGVRELVWGEDHVVALLVGGGVVRILPTGAQALVGDAFEADLEAGVSAAAEFDGKLFAAVGDKLGRYSFEDHSWTSLSPTSGSPIERLCTTARFLYVLAKDGALYRTTAQGDDWERVNDLLGKNRVVSVSAMGEALGVVVGGTDELSGASVLRDVAATEPVRLLSTSAGPAGDAVITCAVELGRELYLGTRGDGLWAWLPGPGRSGGGPFRWQQLTLAPQSQSVGAIRRIVSNPASPNRLAVLTDRSVVLLERGAGKAWRPARTTVEGAPFAVALAPDGAFVASRLGEATTLSHDREGASPQTLVGAGNPSVGKATASVAIDPGNGDLVRVDAGGEVARYRWSDHAFSREDVGGPVGEVFATADELWAWSPAKRTLFHGGGGSWQPYLPGAIRQVAGDDRGLLLRTTKEEILLKEGVGRAITLLPESARGRGLDLKAIEGLAELGGWLVVGTPQGVRAYDGRAHRWIEVCPDPVAFLVAAPRTPGGAPPTSAYVGTREGRVLWLDASGTEPPRVSPVDFPIRSPVTGVHRAGGRSFALTRDGVLFELKRGSVSGPPLVQPVPLAEKVVPLILAAAEWNGTLFVSFTGADGDKVASYDPDQKVWTSFRTKEGRVTRFFKLTDGSGREQLLAEARPTDADPSAAERTLIQFQWGGLGSEWQYQRVASGLRDVTTDGRSSLWVIDKDHRLLVIRPGADRLSPLLPSDDTLPQSIRGAVTLGTELIVLTAEGELWQYSLDSLSWSRQMEWTVFSTLLEIRGNPVVVEPGTGAVYCFQAGDSGRSWTRLPAEGWNSAVSLDLPPPAEAPRWSLGTDSPRPEFSFSAREGEAFHPVRLQDGRFDFNRFRRIAYRKGTLWCETLAVHSGGSVFRKFTVGSLRVEEPDGKWRFAIPAGEARTGIEGDARFGFEGRRFRLSVRKDGAWAGRDPQTSARLSFGLELLAEGDRKGTAFPLRPVRLPLGGVGMDIDSWVAVASAGENLVALTPGGLLTIALPTPERSGIRRLALEPKSGVFRGFAPGEKGPLAGFGETDARVFAFQPDRLAWREVTDEPTRTRYHRGLTVLRYNALLTGWRISEGPSLEIRTPEGGKPFVPVTLTEEGFGFDRPIAFELEKERIVFYTPDGRVVYRRGASLGPLLDLDPSHATGFIGPARVARHPSDGRLALLTGPSEGSRGIEHDGNGWRTLSSGEVRRFREALREKVLIGGWTWFSDERVELRIPPFEEKPLVGRYVTDTGQFSFDTIRAIESSPDGLWAATDEGVLVFRRQGGSVVLSGFALNGSPPFGAPVEAEFVRALDGRDYLAVDGGTRGRKALFEFRGAWGEPADRGDAAEQVREAARWLVHGRMWQAVEDEANPRGTETRRGFSMATTPGGGEFAAVRLLRDGTWDFENLSGICGPDVRPVLASSAGVMRIDRETGDYLIANTASPVVRIEREGENCHLLLQDDRGEALLSSRTLESAGEPAETFPEKDRTLLDGANWKIRKLEESGGREGGRLGPRRRGSGGRTARVEVRPGPGEEFRPARFRDGRFDFDRVLDLGLVQEDVLLATEHGFIRWRGTSATGFAVEPGLPPVLASEALDLFPIRSNWKSTLYVEHPRGSVYRLREEWTRLQGETADRALRDRDEVVARSATWSVRRISRETRIGVALGVDSEVTASFSPRDGAFRFDLIRDVLNPENADGPASMALLATDGGVCSYSPRGQMVRLRSDLLGTGGNAAAVRLVRTPDGPLAEVVAQGRRGFVLLADGEWASIPASDAQARIRDALTRIHTDPEAWTIRHDESGTFDISWAEEPVTLLRDRGTRFAHDVSLSAEWFSDSVWVATRGGVVRYVVAGLDGALLPAPSHHILTQGIPGAAEGVMRAFSIRAVPEDRVVVRTLDASGKESRHGSTGAETAFAPEGRDDGSPDVLLDVPGFWRWRLAGPSRVEVDLAPEAFTLPDAFAGGDLFSNGTVSFWDLSPAASGSGRPSILGDSWCFPTTAGVLRLSADLTRTERVYGRSATGDSMAEVTHLPEREDDRFAVAEGAVFRYSPPEDEWRMVAGVSPEEVIARPPIRGRFLELSLPPAGGVRVGFAEGVSDATDTPSLLRDGGFVFDVVRDFAWSDTGCWTVTPIGLVHVSEKDGGIRVFEKDWRNRSESIRLSAVPGEGVFCLGGSGEVWSSSAGDASWAEREDGADWRERLRTLAENELFRCVRGEGDGLEIRLRETIGEFPPFRLGESEVRLLRDGLFGFDDVRDTRLVGPGDLLLSTRIGIWRYGLSGETRLHLPVGADWYADAGAERASMSELGLFLRDPASPEEVFVYASTGAYGFLQQPGGTWKRESRALVVDDSRTVVGPDGESWVVSLGDDSIAVELAGGDDPSRDRMVISESHATEREERSRLLQSLFSTEDWIWVPAGRRLAWVRKSRF